MRGGHPALSAALASRARGRGTALAGLLLLLLAAFAWRNVVDLDFGIHMASGRWIVENGRVPANDPFTYTVSERPYVAYHWLFQVGAYQLQRAAGFTGLAAARLAIALAAAWLLLDLLRLRGVSPLAGSAVALAVILAVEPRLRLRPELASYALAAATLWVLERHRLGRRAPLWLLPVIQIVWVNTHVYALGWLILGVYLLDEWLRERRLRTRLLAWTAASAVALLANPYHLRAVAYPLYLATRMSADNTFAQVILELRSPLAFARDPEFRTTMLPQLVAYGGLLAIGAAALPGALRARRWADAGLVLVFGALSLLAMRNVALFAIATAPSLAAALDAWIRRPLASTRGRRLGDALVLALAGFAALTLLRVVAGGFYAAANRPERFGAGLCRTCLATEAADWIADHELRGNVFNNLNIGATLLWRNPAHRVFIDGRNEVTGEAFFRIYLAASRAENWERTQRRYGIEYAVLAFRHDRALSDRLLNGGGWRLVYVDGAAAVFVREAGPNAHLAAVRLPRPLGHRDRWRSLRRISVDARPSARLRRWLGFGDPPLDRDFFLGTWLLAMGRLGAAEDPLVIAANRSPGHPQVHNNLGVLYYRARLWNEAWFAFQNLRALDPDHPSLAYLPEIEARLADPGAGR